MWFRWVGKLNVWQNWQNWNTSICTVPPYWLLERPCAMSWLLTGRQYITIVYAQEGQLPSTSFRRATTNPSFALRAMCQSNVFVNGGTGAKFQINWPIADQGYLLFPSTRSFKKICTQEAARETICVLWLHKLPQLCCHPYLCTSILASIFEN